MAGYLLAATTVVLLALICLAYTVRAFPVLHRGRRRRNRVLIVVEQPFEAAAIRNAVSGPRRRRRGLGRNRVEYLATCSRARLYLVIAGDQDTPAEAGRCVARSRADLVILAGVCRGLFPDRQLIGDLVLGAVLRYVDAEPASPADPCALKLTDRFDESYYLLTARLRVQERVVHEGVFICHGDLPPSWTLADDLAALDRGALAACSERSSAFVTAALRDRRCVGWAAIRAVAWYGQHRTNEANDTAAASVAELIAATARSTALDYR